MTSSVGDKGVVASDCALGATVSTNFDGKIVDLDPDQQFISQVRLNTLTITRSALHAHSPATSAVVWSESNGEPSLRVPCDW